jgi:hypothetical protein
MTTETDETSGLSWGFGSAIFEPAFHRLATALRWMFWGLLMQLLGAAIAVAPLGAGLAGLAPLNGKLVLPGLLLLLVGGIVLVIGEQKCLHLELPLGMTRDLPGHGWLRAAYWCHLGSWLLRIARNLIGRLPAGLVLLPLQFIGFVFLLLFLRKTADVLARQDLRRLVDAVFAMAFGALLIFAFLAAEAFLHVGVLKMLPRAAALLVLALPILLFAATVGSYVILLGRMASAAAQFAKYLAAAEEPSADATGG